MILHTHVQVRAECFQSEHLYVAQQTRSPNIAGHVASGSEDSIINTWNVSVSTCEDQLPPQLPIDTRNTHKEGTSVFCLAAMGDNALASGSSDGSIKIWRRNRCEATLLGHTQVYGNCYFALSGFLNTM